MKYSLTELLMSLGGMSTIIITVLSLIGKIFIEKLKNDFQNEISRIKQYNDISKETYQKLSDALQVYFIITKEHLEYDYHPSGQSNEYDEAFKDLSCKIKELIMCNQIIISDELVENYKKIYSAQSEYFYKHNIMSKFPEQTDPDDYRAMISELRTNTESLMKELIIVVENDISKLRGYLSGY